jgi:quercetin dioxygenase-like cupin family protein
VLSVQPTEASVNKFHRRLPPALVLAAITAPAGIAQQLSTPAAPLYSSKPIMVSPLTGDAKKEVVLLSVSIEPGGAVPMHTHPGDCVGSVVEGIVELSVEGQPPRRIAAGEAYGNVRGTVHGFRNPGATPAKLLNSLVVDKGLARVLPATPLPTQ